MEEEVEEQKEIPSEVEVLEREKLPAPVELLELPSPRKILRERIRLEHDALIALKAQVEMLRGKLPLEFRPTEFSKLAKAYTLEALAVLREGLEAPSWSVRLEAAKVLLAYAWGKPREMAMVEEAIRPLAGMSTEELTITLKRTLAQYEPIEGGGRVAPEGDGAVRAF